MINAKTRNGERNPARTNRFANPLERLFKFRVFARRQRKERRFVDPGRGAGGENRLGNLLDGAVTERTLEPRALAEAAFLRTTAHNLERNAVLDAFDEREKRTFRRRESVQIANDRRVDIFRDAVGVRAGTPRSAGFVERNVVKLRNVSVREFAGDLEKRVAPERFRGRVRVAAGGQIRGRVAADGAVFRVEGPFDAELRAEFGPTFEERRERFFAVADQENVDEIGHNLRRRGGGASGDDERNFERTVDAPKRDAGEVEHCQNVRVTKLVLERKTEEIERGERGKGFERINREVRVSEDRLHIGAGAEGALASEVFATVDDVVKNRQRDVRHPDRINVRKTEAHPRFHRVGGFDDLTDFAADVLTGEANVREK